MDALKDYSRNLKPHLRKLETDEAGLNPSDVVERYGIPPQEVIMLSRNENPYGPSPRVWEALKDVSLHSYPESKNFMKAISDFTGYPAENIVIGAGMDEIISTIGRLFLGDGDGALIPIPTYTYYALTVGLCGGFALYQPRLPYFRIKAEILKRVKMIFLCSPNNPTGDVLSEQTVRSIAENADGVVFLDEAYVEFAESDLLRLVKEHDNLVIGRTLSKAFGLAGLRIGYAVTPQWLAETYRRISPLFSVSSLSMAAGAAALQDVEYMKKSVRKIVRERERMQRRLEGADPSQGNFLFVHTRGISRLIADRLLTKGIAVRDCSSFRGAGDHCIRVTVGTPEQNDRFLEAFVIFDRP